LNARASIADVASPGREAAEPELRKEVLGAIGIEGRSSLPDDG
jgi:hypothetical protein